MAIYQSMQRVRFSSADGYEKFKLLFGEVRNQLKTLPGFLHDKIGAYEASVGRAALDPFHFQANPDWPAA